MPQVSSVSMTAIAKNDTKPQGAIEKIQEKVEQIPDGEKQIICGLTALGALALGALAVSKGKTKAAKEAVEAAGELVTNKKVTNAVSETAQDITKGAAKKTGTRNCT